MKRTFWNTTAALILASGLVSAQGRGGQAQPPAQSPASTRPPQTVTPQTYPPDQVQVGRARFASQCAFCHGSDAAGGETGPDLSRSTLVAQDARGDKIGPFVRAGRLDKGMPAFDLNDSDLGSIVAFIHTQKTLFESLGGGRRSVDVADLQTGNVEAGKAYFNGAGNCSKCHSATGDLAGIAGRFQGLPLLQRLLYPTSGRPAPAPPKATVTLPSGETITGPVVARDEFSISLTDPAGMRRTWQVDAVKYTVDDPLSAHFEQLGKYTDTDIHNVFAYLQTLK